MLSAPVFLECRSAPTPYGKKGVALPNRSFWKKGVALPNRSFMKRMHSFSALFLKTFKSFLRFFFSLYMNLQIYKKFYDKNLLGRLYSKYLCFQEYVNHSDGETK